MLHDHAHHDHEPARSGASQHAPLNRAFGIGVALNVAFAGAEAAFGLYADSTALVADAAHNASDVLGLVLAWLATTVAKRAPSKLHTYGFRRATVMAALANAVLLLAAVVGVAWEAASQLRSPGEPHSPTMMVVALAGVLVNTLSALLFLRASKADANVRGAFLHLAADAAVSVGVVAAGFAIWLTGWRWIDPVAGLAVGAAILAVTWRLLRDALHLALDGVPRQVDLEQVRAYLLALPDVRSVHDLHVWAMSTTETALSAHLVIPWSAQPPAFLGVLDGELAQRFGIDHATVQLEPLDSSSCPRVPSGAC